MSRCLAKPAGDWGALGLSKRQLAERYAPKIEPAIRALAVRWIARPDSEVVASAAHLLASVGEMEDAPRPVR